MSAPFSDDWWAILREPGATGSSFGIEVVYELWTVYYKETRLEPAPSLHKDTTLTRLTDRRREKRDGIWCWTEAEMVNSYYTQSASIRYRRAQIWRVNITLENYYSFIEGSGPGITALGAGAANLICSTEAAASLFAYAGLETIIGGTTTATGIAGGMTAVEAVAAGGAVVGTALTFFVGTTYFMDWANSAFDLVAETWVKDDVHLPGTPVTDPITWGQLTHVADGIPYWERIGPVRRCKDAPPIESDPPPPSGGKKSKRVAKREKQRVGEHRAPPGEKSVRPTEKPTLSSAKPRKRR